MEASEYDVVLDVIVPYSEIEISLMDVRLVLDVDEAFPEEIRFKRKRLTLFEAASLFKNPELKKSLNCWRAETQKLQTQWGRKSVHTIDAKEFYRTFKLSLQIWSIRSHGENTLNRQKIFDRRGSPKLIGKLQIFKL